MNILYYLHDMLSKKLSKESEKITKPSTEGQNN